MHLSTQLAFLFAILPLPFTLAAKNDIVPAGNPLPACAALCGPLFDVEGGCTPQARPTIDKNCFCGDARLSVLSGSDTTSIGTLCGPQSCTAEADLQAIKTWYASYCGGSTGGAQPTTAAGGAPGATTTAATNPSQSTGASSGSGSSGSTSGGNSGGGGSWIENHYKWVIMLVVLLVVIIGGWILACVFRRRYLRRKEREFEMRPPIAMGPHHMQNTTGGYSYGDGVVNAGARGAGGHSKEARSTLATPADAAKRESKGWLRKVRK